MRLFVAVWPPPSIVDAIAALERPPVDRLRWTVPDQWHVTLRFLGDVQDDEVTGVVEALDHVDPTPTTAVMGPETGRFGNRILHVPVAGLDAVAAEVVSATAPFGQPPDDRPFHGHLTLARVGRGKGRGPDLRPFVGRRLEGEWPVGGLTLVRSRLGSHGSRYEVVHQRPLAAG